jgi:thiamine kinase-like enzyme
MDDATLNGEQEGSQGFEDDLGAIVPQLERKLGDSAGEPVPLDGGITSRNFRARFGDTDYVIRVPGKDTSLLEIDRRAELAANECAARVGIAPAVATMLDEPECIVTVYVEGEGMDSASLRRPATLSAVATALHGYHGCCETLPSTFDSFRIVETYADTAIGRGATLPDAYDEAHARAAEVEAALAGHEEHVPVPCHNDLLAANFIAGERLWIVDWEYAGMGDRYFDLANFAVNNELGEAAEESLLHDYFGQRATPRRLAALRLMRFMSDFREAMWGVLQRVVSELDFDFAEYADHHFDRLRETASDPRFDAWLKEAREPAS